MIELENLSDKEIEPFIDSLSDEKDLSELYLGMLPNAKFVTVARVDKELAGIAGITETGRSVLGPFRVPYLFISVKSQFRRRGIGNEMMQNIITFTKERYCCLTLSTRKPEKYMPAVNLYLKKGFKIFCAPGIHYYMGLPFNKRGEFVCRYLSIIFMISQSPVGRVLSHWLQFLSKKLSSIRGHRGEKA